VYHLRIAPIWNDEKHQKDSNLDFIRNHYINPYFFGGFLRCIEKGEVIVIGNNQEFFINDCKPKNGGIVVDRSNVTIEIEYGFTREVFKRK
jgi:hypothetical protein